MHSGSHNIWGFVALSCIKLSDTDLPTKVPYVPTYICQGLSKLIAKRASIPQPRPARGQLWRREEKKTGLRGQRILHVDCNHVILNISLLLHRNLA
jgi:hypothetical protein